MNYQNMFSTKQERKQLETSLARLIKKREKLNHDPELQSEFDILIAEFQEYLEQ